MYCLDRVHWRLDMIAIAACGGTLSMVIAILTPQEVAPVWHCN